MGSASGPLAAHALWEHCMAVYNGHEDISQLMQFMRFVLGWWADQMRPIVQLCQQV
jgi:hypothetical protein